MKTVVKKHTLSTTYRYPECRQEFHPVPYLLPRRSTHMAINKLLWNVHNQYYQKHTAMDIVTDGGTLYSDFVVGGVEKNATKKKQIK